MDSPIWFFLAFSLTGMTISVAAMVAAREAWQVEWAQRALQGFLIAFCAWAAFVIIALLIG